MKKIILSCLVIFSFSCKNEDKKATEVQTPIKKEVVKDNLFKIIMEAKVKEDDKFQVFFTDDSPEESFSANKRLVKNIVGSEEFQTLEFVLPKEVLPFKFRIDLGENSYETLVEIGVIKLEYNNEVIEIDPLTLERFFQPNIYLQKTDNGFMRKTIDGRCDPFLMSTPLLIKKIELEL
ncbi:hypothetical protein [Pontimicrobium sp. SW4]|uniref:Lipoprotein n=1 Tax=Pontimicrobium sp. SW4 TaxID=3153519 RepID=A0AAU7BST2_9FLAO